MVLTRLVIFRIKLFLNFLQTVEEFLSKDVTFVITDSKEVDQKCSPRSQSTPSPGMFNPSPSLLNKRFGNFCCNVDLPQENFFNRYIIFYKVFNVATKFANFKHLFFLAKVALFHLLRKYLVFKS